MTYQETLEYLYNSTPVFEHIGADAYKENLHNTLTLDEHFGHPHRSFKTIHVAGTNGKGSVSHSLASILQCMGLKVGLYTSPHLVDFRERIRINGLTISEQYVVEFVEKERHFFEPLHPSFFELTTALAFKYFAEERVDIAVIEVGLGGRLDCTNIITPVLSVITNISFDHMQFLGDTLGKIASEKAGVIKPNIPVVVGETTIETRMIFEEKAREMNAPITFAEQFDIPMIDEISFELNGDCQTKNKRTILCAASLLDFPLPAIQEGMKNVCQLTGLMGRWQKITNAPTTICDTGHNAAGWEYITRQLQRQSCHNLRIVFGMVDDKDIKAVMSMLPSDAVYYFTQASTKRAITADKIKQYGNAVRLTGKTYDTVEAAYLAARKEAAPNDFIFVGGSSYVVADLLTFLHKEKSSFI